MLARERSHRRTTWSPEHAYQRDAESVVRDWRQLLRHMERTDQGSVEREVLMAELERLQDEYSGLREEAFRQGRNMPPMPPE